MFGPYAGPQFPFPFQTLAAYHPGFALAILRGVSVRPNLRVMQWAFNNQSIGQPVNAAFDQQITGYSVFAGFDLTIDPTGAFPQNLFKTLSDGMQTLTTGITMQLLMRTKGNLDYSPIPTDCPLQLVPGVLSRSAGIWHLDNPDEAKGQLTLIAPPPAPVFTVWGVFSYLVLGPEGEKYVRMDPLKARAAVASEITGGNAPASP